MLESEVELRSALAVAALGKGHFFDARRELAPNPKGLRRLMEDVASFVVNGRLTPVGVAEDRERAGSDRGEVPRQC